MSDLREEYDQKGYVIVRGAIDPDLAQETVGHVHWLCERYPDVRPERLHHFLLVDDPSLDDPILCVRDGRRAEQDEDEADPDAKRRGA